MTDELARTDRRQQLDTARELATHTAEIKNMKADMDQMVNALKDMNATLVSINTTLAEAKGGWKMLMVVGGAGGAIGSFLTQVLDLFPSK